MVFKENFYIWDKIVLSICLIVIDVILRISKGMEVEVNNFSSLLELYIFNECIEKVLDFRKKLYYLFLYLGVI